MQESRKVSLPHVRTIEAEVRCSGACLRTLWVLPSQGGSLSFAQQCAGAGGA